MGHFDISNGKKYLIHYIVIIVIVIIIMKLINGGMMRECKGKGIPGRPILDGNGTAYNQGRGSESDSISTLLDRIDWASYVDKRTTLWYKVFIISLIVSALISLLVLRKIPSPMEFAMTMICVFIPIYAIHQHRYVHGDIYNDYNIKNNADIIRSKLNLEKGKKVPVANCRPPKRRDVMNPN